MKTRNRLLIAAAMLWLGMDTTLAQVIRRVPRGESTRNRERVVRGRDDDRSTRVVRRTPARGTVIKQLPERHARVVHRSREYYVHDDTFYLQVGVGSGVQFVVSAPPIGAFLSILPDGCDRVVYGGRRYYAYDDCYYEEVVREGRRGYVVVEPPLGAALVRLPDDYLVVVIGGERLYCCDDYYYRAVDRGGRITYVRIDPPSRHCADVSGVVVYRDRSALPPDAIVNLRLVDMSSAERGRILAEQTIGRVGQIPIPFRLRYDPTDLNRLATYVVEAEIIYAGRPRYRNLNMAPVITRGNPDRVEIIVERI